MKSIRIHEHGGIDVLQWEDISTPVPGPRQVLINIKAGALNHLDLWVRNGIPGVPLPIILGSDGSGIVTDKGEEVTGFKSGDEVMVQPLVFCGECQQCIRGQENLCATMGILGESCDGTFAEKIILLYGGSVDENSVNRLLGVKLINGFLIGSASANFEAFKAIAEKIKL